jgi:sugar/nucleoside kinase (ribokinase family)
MRVCVLGDLVLDVVVRPRQPPARGADTVSAVTLSAGGQGANVAAWVAALGGRARWVGRRADDAAGSLATAQLEALGVELAGPVSPQGSGVIVSLVEPGGERSMYPDRGVASELEPADVTPAWLVGCDRLHVSGYALLRDPVAAAAAALIELAHARGVPVSVDLSSWSAIRDRGVARVRAELERLAPAVVFATEAESETVGGPFAGAVWILKRGAAGCSFDGVELAAVPVDRVVDTTGAGDALAAGWLVGGPEVALAAAACCVQRPGAMPPRA